MLSDRAEHLKVGQSVREPLGKRSEEAISPAKEAPLKRVLITGATGGIGQALASVFMRQEGVQMVLSGTNQGRLELLKQRLVAQSKAECVDAEAAESPVFHTVACRLTEAEEMDQLASKAMDLMGGVDILINNAGQTRDGLLMRLSDDAIDQVLSVNLNATIKLTRAFIPSMMKKRQGVIVNISSVVASTGNAGQTNYVASKAGVEGFTRALALEVAGRGIRVNAVAPGFIATPMTDMLSEVQKEKLMARIPLGRMGTAYEIAEAAYFLASPAASYVTGSVLHVNGGLYCGG